jgi:hypothetical protein
LLERWQFNVLFFVAIAGVIVVLFADKLGLEIGPNGYMGIGAILTFILTQGKKRESNSEKKEADDASPPSSSG